MSWNNYIKHISVSQIKTHERNPRRWALEKLLKLPTCDSPYTVIGSEIHEAIENILTNQAKPEEYKGIVYDCLEEFIRNINFYSRPLEVERRISVVLEDVLPPILGYIDVYIPDFNGSPMIIDHKTSRAGRYFLKHEALKKDLQMNIYAYWALQQAGDACRGVWVQHNQFTYSKKKDRLKIVRVWLEREGIESIIQETVKEVKEGLMQTVQGFEESGMTCISTAKCGRCRNAFGPNSCEYAPICEGYISAEEYKEIYNKRESPIYIQDVLDDINKIPLFSDLTKIENLDIIEEKEEVMLTTTKNLDLGKLMKAGREKFSKITNTWDRRDAITAVVIKEVLSSGVDSVEVPSHMAKGSIDPDYMAIITLLKENGIAVYAKVEI